MSLFDSCVYCCPACVAGYWGCPAGFGVLGAGGVCEQA